ncbi:bactofilin family protein [Thermosediminibacter litoriperuensis]|uniref:Cytoskeletal protein CcmA (Bactofilin family) n=1 Tax=Thermosediminibacter litoriperuensis TaxID=291989 RepID=A0A5S5AX60_9FIRM|nr:polymer-forming cytoskeletal protein [Thermosediminibacter litoriperuensis]TYP57420.1 cytoskeletal protein CcmA (bactofilin family) [Thermosediminibacter litoriperuensis]
MFGKRGENVDINTDRVDTLLGKGTEFKGTVKASGVLRVEGRIEGEIESSGDIIIAEGGVVNAQIKARNAIVAGEINGNMILIGKLEIKSSGKVLGDLKVEGITIEDGAVFEGRCEMSREKKPKTQKTDPT